MSSRTTKKEKRVDDPKPYRHPDTCRCQADLQEGDLVRVIGPGYTGERLGLVIKLDDVVGTRPYVYTRRSSPALLLMPTMHVDLLSRVPPIPQLKP